MFAEEGENNYNKEGRGCKLLIEYSVYLKERALIILNNISCCLYQNLLFVKRILL